MRKIKICGVVLTQSQLDALALFRRKRVMPSGVTGKSLFDKGLLCIPDTLKESPVLDDFHIAKKLPHEVRLTKLAQLITAVFACRSADDELPYPLQGWTFVCTHRAYVAYVPWQSTIAVALTAPSCGFTYRAHRVEGVKTDKPLYRISIHRKELDR